MTLFTRSAAVLAIVAGVTVITGGQTPAWPPALQNVSDESPVLTPAQSMAKIVMPPGYRLELVVSEPMVQDPVAIDFDSDGRMYVIEMVGYMQDMPASNEHNPTGRVVVLEDTNDDGTMD